jgi:hypothetical protein
MSPELPPLEVSMPIAFLAVLLSLFGFALTAASVEAHGGGLDLFGCHHDLQGYHCHEGQLLGQQFASQEKMFAALEPGRTEATMQAHEVVPRQKAKGEGCIREARTAKIICGERVPR